MHYANGHIDTADISDKMTHIVKSVTPLSLKFILNSGAALGLGVMTLVSSLSLIHI